MRRPVTQHLGAYTSSRCIQITQVCARRNSAGIRGSQKPTSDVRADDRREVPGSGMPQGLCDVPPVAPLSGKVELFDENSPGEMVVTAVPVTSEVWPRALDAQSLAILPRAPEALLAPVAQVLPGVRASKRHGCPHDRRSTRVEP